MKIFNELPSTVATFLREFKADTKGAVLVYCAVAAPMFLGVAALSIDMAVWHAEKRGVQTMADSAALAAGLELRRGGNASGAALTDAQENGFNAGNGDLIQVVSPPTSGLYAGDTTAVEVQIWRPVQTYAAGLIFSDQAAISSRAVARGETNDSCIWGLDPAASGAVSVSGSASVNLNCGVFSNSAHGNGLTAVGSSTLNATEIKVVGGVSGSPSNFSPTPQTGRVPFSGPARSLAGSGKRRVHRPHKDHCQERR